MYQGSFPAGPQDDVAPSARRSPPLCRRRFLIVAAAFVAGGAVGGIGGRWSRDDPATPPARTDAPLERGTLAWALSLLDARDGELVAAAGDLERVSVRHRGEERLVPLFERVLDAALRDGGPIADDAAACAIRSLVRLGRPDLAVAREADIEGAPAFVNAAEALVHARRGGQRR